MKNPNQVTDGSIPLKNPRWEKCAQARAKGQTIAAAYNEAGHRPGARNGKRLLARPEIAARISWLQAQAAKQTVTTVEDIVLQLDADRELAHQNGHASPAVAATMAKAKVLGLIVDRREIGLKRIDDMNEDERG